MSVAGQIRNAKSAVRLRARWIVPVDMPPIEDGEVVIEEGRITGVGKARGRNPDAIDFGMAAILPGFVNVHAHLEYTILRGMLEDMPFFPWVRTLNSLKQYLDLIDWVASSSLGAAEMAAAGVTTVVDASDAGAALTALIGSGQRGIVCREVFGIEAEPTVETTVNVLDRRLAEMRSQIARAGVGERLKVGISPHAPYTVRPALFRALADYATERRLMQTIHIAETQAETDLIGAGTGPFAEMFGRRHIAWDAPGVSPVAYAEKVGAFDAPQTLAVHAVHVDAEDAATLARRNVSVAHCPKSNGKLAAGFAPLRLLRDAGVAVGLGTDSMASNNAVDMFEEMRMALFQARNREGEATALKSADALHLATLGGATALGMADQVGSLRSGKRADLCVARLDGWNVAPGGDDNPIGSLVFGGRASDILLTMVDGAVIYEGGRALMVDVPRAIGMVTTARANLWRKAEPILAPLRRG